MNDGRGEEADPFREQLDSRWKEYLSTGRPPVDHERWTTMALAYYRDEIVHYGAQLLNDVAIRPWNEENAQSAFEDYLTTARAYDVDPRAWEASFRARIRRSASTDLRSEHGEPMR